MGRPINTTALTVDIAGDAIAGATQLKARRSGCDQLARELIQARLVDEILFWIHPRVVLRA
jgi:hypothetical protein